MGTSSRLTISSIALSVSSISLRDLRELIIIVLTDFDFDLSFFATLVAIITGSKLMPVPLKVLVLSG